MLDRAVGLRYAGGDAQEYENLLRTFQLDNRHMPDTLRSAAESGDWESFRACAHSLKGTCACIGALALAETATELEKAVKAGNTAFALEEYPDFLHALEALLEQIRRLPQQLRDTDNLSPGPPELLAENLAKMQVALQSFNLYEAEQIIAALEAFAWDAKVEIMLDGISEDILLSEYTAALSKIQAFA